MSQHLASAASATSSRTASSALWPRSISVPFAITVGMTTGALITGNTAVVKPASTTPLTAHAFYDALAEAGIPDGVVNLVTGGGRAVGQPMIEHGDVAGFVFTGSARSDSRSSGPSTSFGQTRASRRRSSAGRTPVIVSRQRRCLEGRLWREVWCVFVQRSEVLDRPRGYVHEDIADEFTEQLVERRTTSPSASPRTGETVVSPLIDDSAIERYDDICENGGRGRHGPDRRSRIDRENLPTGRYVEPTVVTDIPHDHALATDEHFLPFVTIHPVSSLEEGITKANDSDYGLCAGLFSEDEDRSTRGSTGSSPMCYVNREQSSATTGALVEAQPFGGWKYYRDDRGNSRAVRGTSSSSCVSRVGLGRRRRTALRSPQQPPDRSPPTVRRCNIPD